MSRRIDPAASPGLKNHNPVINYLYAKNQNTEMT
jgi:hypothetical protein